MVWSSAGVGDPEPFVCGSFEGVQSRGVGLLEVGGGMAERGEEGVSDESVVLLLVPLSGVRPGWYKVGGMSMVAERRGGSGNPGEVVGGSNSGIGLCLAATLVRSWNRPFWDPDRLLGVEGRQDLHWHLGGPGSSRASGHSAPS